MSNINQLQLVLRNSLTTLHALDVTQFPPTLKYCLQHGDTQRLWDDASHRTLATWQYSVLHTLPTEVRSSGLPAAALSWCGEGGALRSGTWMHIDLVHFSAGMNDVHIMSAGEISDEDIQQLMTALQPLLSLAGFELHCSAANHWYVWCEEVLDVQTHALQIGLTTRSYDVLPTGNDAPPLRRLLTEIQMLLHQHPLNQQRERQGLSVINAAWFSGAGSPTPATSSTLQRIMSDQPYVQGLCEQLNVTCWPIPRSVTEMLRIRDNDMVLVIDGTNVLQVEEQWLQPLLRGVNRGNVQHLHIYLDHLRVILHGGRRQQLLRWTHRAVNVKELLA